MRRGRSFFFYAFSSFFGALLIAVSFAYNNYRYSKYNFINFNELILYQKKALFKPKNDQYTLVIYSSNMNSPDLLLSKINNKYPIMLIDLYQKRTFASTTKVIHTTAGMNTLLSIIHTFRIKEVPVSFEIVRFDKFIYKQNTKPEVLR